MTNEVTFSTNRKGLATITLNRPKALNSLSLDMIVAIGEQLEAWRNDHSVQVIVMDGAGEKGFCAGGDIKTLSEAQNGGESFEKAREFFKEEYRVDLMVKEYPKPIVACLDGVVMGGGVGLTQGASHRVVTARTKWAMPEMNIGFFPDVGAVHLLNQAPGYTGRYLALTSATIKAADVLYIGAAEHYVSELTDLLDKLHEIDWVNKTDPTGKLDDILAEQNSTPEEEAPLASMQEAIDRYFNAGSIEAIVEKLENGDGAFAAETRETLLSKSPVSEKVTLKHMIDSENKSLAETLEMDLVIAVNFLKHDDFYKGVEAVIFKKSQSPDYTYKRLADVSDAKVEQFFEAS
ncbi:enoyl-CoA hydratase/isomerase family protein [Salicibibacter cibarius]|uniref:3-hydroxyisobutyryl-CoA hydrolase n=1 Tax=Salicibibacter cibarius TaxID=2743000 RepID=A0A7T7CAK7_9BACI|nr:enoyl-CoA hydratase/isomerase family protein [Salicibibacter cibarius]QQK75002.1 enoyl-CoA hydratase/isomerase family protein [Salicibibacter cibarius]